MDVTGIHAFPILSNSLKSGQNQFEKAGTLDAGIFVVKWKMSRMAWKSS
jgi:hypothetical protein